MREGISEQDLAAAVAAGARVRSVVVVEVPPVSGLVPHLLLSDRPGWHPIALRKYEGVRCWRDYRNLRRILAGFGYQVSGHESDGVDGARSRHRIVPRWSPQRAT